MFDKCRLTGVYIEPAMPWSAPIAGRVCSHVHAAYGVSGHALASARVEEISARTRRFAKIRSLFTLGTFVIAMLVALKFPSLGFGLICCALLVYLRPKALDSDEDAGHVEA
jgi:hypothetical protein